MPRCPRSPMIVTLNASHTFKIAFLCVLLIAKPLSVSQEARRLSESVWGASKDSSDLSRCDHGGVIYGNCVKILKVLHFFSLALMTLLFYDTS
jgi:hypothetical protein